MRRRREISVFGMSFLDVMFCGFGSVILLVMIINSETLAQRKVVHQDLRGEVKRLETEVDTGEKYLVEARAALTEAEEQSTATDDKTSRILEQIERIKLELAALEREAQASTEHTNRLKSELKQTESERQQLASEREQAEQSGANVRRFLGEGDRQYVTGLKLGGDRILILVDASASMLHRTIVNILRLRNLPETTRRSAEKWRRALNTVEWLLSQLPPNSRFQVQVFNTESRSLHGGIDWLEPVPRDLDVVVDGLGRVTPSGATSLFNAFDSIDAFEPGPDNIILITDGLPTQGRNAHGSGRVTGKQRLDYFRKAIGKLPRNVPVNTILFPIEGDPFAASEFWKLAIRSGGSMISPSEDWP